MGSGDWLKNIIGLNTSRKQKSKKIKGSPIPTSNEFVYEPRSQEQSTNVTYETRKVVGPVDENTAVIRIQTTFRALMARKAFRRLKGASRLQARTRGDFGQRQTSSTLNRLHSWNKVQAQIGTRRRRMVEDGGIRHKKLENQSRLQAKLRDLDVEWSSGLRTMDDALGRIYQREEAAVKRERAMAYAFSHQWRANSRADSSPNDSEHANVNWGWSWTDRWVAARPWETRVRSESLTPKKVNGPGSKTGKNMKPSPSMQKSNSLKTSPNGKKIARNRKLSFRSIDYSTTETLVAK